MLYPSFKCDKNINIFYHEISTFKHGFTKWASVASTKTTSQVEVFRDYTDVNKDCENCENL